jgi:hypothetical protein
MKVDAGLNWHLNLFVGNYNFWTQVGPWYTYFPYDPHYHTPGPGYPYWPTPPTTEGPALVGYSQRPGWSPQAPFPACTPNGYQPVSRNQQAPEYWYGR